jgi:hypothetical protein
MARKSNGDTKYGLARPGIPGPLRPPGGYGLAPMGIPGPLRPPGGYGLPQKLGVEKTVRTPKGGEDEDG